jgi:hypothetical protein
VLVGRNSLALSALEKALTLHEDAHPLSQCSTRICRLGFSLANRFGGLNMWFVAVVLLEVEMCSQRKSGWCKTHGSGMVCFMLHLERELEAEVSVPDGRGAPADMGCHLRRLLHDRSTRSGCLGGSCC